MKLRGEGSVTLRAPERGESWTADLSVIAKAGPSAAVYLTADECLRLAQWLIDMTREVSAHAGSEHTYRYYARLTPGDEVPSVWCGETDGPNVYEVRRHRSMLTARLHATWRNLRRPKPKPLTIMEGADSAQPQRPGSEEER